jgi:hypothetical protein
VKETRERYERPQLKVHQVDNTQETKLIRFQSVGDSPVKPLTWDVTMSIQEK